MGRLGGVPIWVGIHERDTQQIPGRLAGATRDAQKRVTVRRTESVACGRVAPAGSHTYIQEIRYDCWVSRRYTTRDATQFRDAWAPQLTPNKEKIRLLGFTMLHDSRRYTIAELCSVASLVARENRPSYLFLLHESLRGGSRKRREKLTRRAKRK